VGPGELPYVAAVVGMSVTAMALVAFGLLRRRGSMAWETGSPSGGPTVDTQVADPAIARRIAELVPPSSEPDAFATADDPELADLPGPDAHVLFTDPVEELLSDGSDELIEGEVAVVPESRAEAVVWADAAGAPPPVPGPGPDGPSWPEADPGVVRPLLDAALPSEPAPAVDREALSRLLTDPVTGLGSAVAWELWLADEDPRERRYRRPTTVVLAELDGLDAVVAVHGPGVAERAAAMIGTAVRANVRTSDRAAVVGPGLYAVLLTETDEIQAVNFVERVRATCEDWLDANAPGVGIAFGWASPEGDGVAGARLRAQQRLLRDHR
jgi:GGDEF domain-containing protein